MRIRTVAVILVLASVVCPAHVTEAQTPIFTFKTDDFWLNLHHFLCALGLIEAKLPDASRDAIAPAAADQERGLARLDGNQRRT